VAHSGVHLRPALESDLPLLAEIYATTRAEELRQVPWNEAQKRAFTDSQSLHQERHYALHYPAAERLVIAREGAIGRIYVDTSDASVLLMEVTLLPAFRQQGIGTNLMNVFLSYADELGREASLHVEAINPAKRMYERMGFVRVETHGFYEYMVRAARRSS
jgi:ribosomal protein S18 acetylase RimI-like enzyme